MKSIRMLLGKAGRGDEGRSRGTRVARPVLESLGTRVLPSGTDPLGDAGTPPADVGAADPAPPPPPPAPPPDPGKIEPSDQVDVEL